MNEQKTIAAAPASFDEWWRADGAYIDPDTSDVPWFDKRQELARLAFEAGRAAAAAMDGRVLNPPWIACGYDAANHLVCITYNGEGPGCFILELTAGAAQRT